MLNVGIDEIFLVRDLVLLNFGITKSLTGICNLEFYLKESNLFINDQVYPFFILKCLKNGNIKLLLKDY